ncbi:MAG: protein-glutamate O-methyltransferase CheR [Acidobacteria bacterium]|nr:protein-glutamate O-methyltransferase CheR [Acidobacteriota bacterium]
MRALAHEVDLEIRLLLDAIYHRYQHDFRDYAVASLRRRLAQAVEHLGCLSVSGLQERVLHDPTAFPSVLQYLTVPVSDMFRDPWYFRAVREHVVPVLRTYPSIKLWIAGCGHGEEVYSFAIVLAEEGMLDRTLIYATDINPAGLEAAQAGIYPLDRFRRFTENHRRAGGKSSLSAYYRAAYGSAAIDKRLKKRIVFSDHSLATDSAFGEVQFVSCRNVLIYFNRTLQDRAVGLFHDSLCRRGFLGLGAKESLRFTAHAAAFAEVEHDARIYQRKA